MISKNNPKLLAWLEAKAASEQADAELKTARAALESILPAGTVVPDDFPVYWQASERMVADANKLPDELVAQLTSRVVDTKKVRAYFELNGAYPKGVKFQTSYSLKRRGE